MKLIDLSSNIFYSDVQEAADTSVTKILTWLLAHIGDLNTRLATCHKITGNDVSPELNNAEAAIFGILYLYNYYLKQVTNNLGAAQFSVLTVKEGDYSVTTVNRNEISKVWRGLAQDTLNNLNFLIKQYRQNNSLPVSINNPYLQPYWSFLYRKQVDPGLSLNSCGENNCNPPGCP